MNGRDAGRWWTSAWAITATLVSLLPVTSLAGEDDARFGRFDRKMRTKSTAIVHVAPRRYSPRLSRIDPGAVVRFAETGERKGCREGWLEREGGGFVCASHLAPEKDAEVGPAEVDRPDILEGARGWRVGRGGARLFEHARDIDAGHVYRWLRRDSYLMVKETLVRYGTEYHKTRAGWWVTAANTEPLPAPVSSLRVEVPADGEVPARIPIASGEVASVRKAPVPAEIGATEKWIAVDLEQQLLHAYVGERLVMVVPCSTGVGDNTRPGRYRIQWKRRMQTMQLRSGHLRVEDVQWVMYYDRRNSIAIHAAYWHSDFGRRVSHGCVNLPPEDARWLYEWSLPIPLPEDSESFGSKENPGTRVVVFE